MNVVYHNMDHQSVDTGVDEKIHFHPLLDIKMGQ
jgi:hypothetical protein